MSYWHAIRTHRLLIVTVTALAVAVALAVVVTASKRYDAEADLQIQPLATFQGGPLQGLPPFVQPADTSCACVTAAKTFSSPAYLGAFQGTLGPAGKQASISVTPLSQADIVALQVSASNPRVASSVANNFSMFLIAHAEGRVSEGIDAEDRANRYPDAEGTAPE